MIRFFHLLFAVLALAAGTAAAQDFPGAFLDMAKDGYNIYDPPMPLPVIAIKDEYGKAGTVQELVPAGRWHLLHIKGRYCKKDNADIPGLVKLKQSREGKLGVAVISIAPVDKLTPPTPELPTYYADSVAILQMLGVVAPPVNFLIDEEGRIRLKIMGNINWTSEESLAFLDGLIQNRPLGADVSRPLPVNNFTGFSD